MLFKKVLAPPFRRCLFIRTDATPNENSLKFIADELTTALKHSASPSPSTAVHEFTSEKEARRAPLAKSLLSIPFVRSVFYGSDFVTVEKEPRVRWEQLKPQICGVIMDHLMTQQPLLHSEKEGGSTAEEGVETDDPALLDEVQTIMDARIRPVVQDDGGDISVVAVKGGYVHLKLRGACRSCSSSTITLKNGIENMLMHYLEGVRGVVQVKDEGEEAAQEAFSEFERRSGK